MRNDPFQVLVLISLLPWMSSKQDCKCRVPLQGSRPILWLFIQFIPGADLSSGYLPCSFPLNDHELGGYSSFWGKLMLVIMLFYVVLGIMVGWMRSVIYGLWKAWRGCLRGAFLGLHGIFLLLRWHSWLWNFSEIILMKEMHVKIFKKLLHYQWTRINLLHERLGNVFWFNRVTSKPFFPLKIGWIAVSYWNSQTYTWRENPSVNPEMFEPQENQWEK